MAADILDVGESKIWINPTEIKPATEAMTRDDVRKLVAQRIVRKRKDHYHSRGGARILHAKKRKGRKSGMGKRTGTKKARTQPKKQWIARVRSLRKKLREMRTSGELKGNYAKLYRQVKGNVFRGKRHLETIAKEEKA